MDFEEPDDQLINAVLDEVASGPLPIGELLIRLRDRGVLAVEFDDEVDLENSWHVRQLAHALLMSEEFWTTDDGVVASMSAMFEGVVFTHRVSQDELARQQLGAFPDLAVLGFDVDDDVALEGGGTVRFTFLTSDAVDFGDDEVLTGPTGWLGVLAESSIALVSRSNGVISIRPGDELGAGEREIAAMRAVFGALYEDGVALELDLILIDVLCRDPTLFRTPVAPVRELLEQAGLELQGDWVAPVGVVARPPGVIHRELLIKELAQRFEFDRCCTRAFEHVLEAWSNLVLRHAPPEDARAVARALEHGAVGPAFAEHVLGDADAGIEQLDEFASILAALNGHLSVTGHFLASLNAERDHRTIDAEREILAAVVADGTYEPALLELSWYAADRGEAARAISLRRRSSVSPDDPEIEYLEGQLGPPTKNVGRNDPCPCGSGHKFKACCITGRTLSLEERAGWLYHKVMRFSMRPQNRWRLEELFDVAMAFAEEESSDSVLPILADLAAFDDESLEHFIEARGVVLPADELALLSRWVGSRAALYQVIAREPGAWVEVLDTLTGGRITVSERTASRSLRDGDYVFTRILEAGPVHQFMSLLIPIPMAQRERLLTLLGDGADTEELASWVGLLFAPVHMVNYEHEETVLCHLVVRPRDVPWDEFANRLDTTFESTEPSHWTEIADLNGDQMVRCFLTRQGDTLDVTTNSRERLERVRAILEELGDGIEVLEETSTDADALRTMARTKNREESLGSDDLPDEAIDALRELFREKETAWLGESIPALGGLTPYEAAIDPTRREDLIALLNEFDRFPKVPRGTMTFDTARLRAELDIADSE